MLPQTPVYFLCFQGVLCHKQSVSSPLMKNIFLFITSLLPHLLSDMPDKACPEGSAACLVTSQHHYNMGSPSGQLELLSSDRYY